MAKKKKLTKAERKEARLRKGKQWLLTYTGSSKKMNKHYRERFYVDAVTAAKDLQELGVNYTQEQLDQIDVGGHRTGDLLGCISIFIDVAKDFIAVHQDFRCYDVGFIFRFGFHVIEHELMNRGGFRHIPVKLVMP